MHFPKVFLHLGQPFLHVGSRFCMSAKRIPVNMDSTYLKDEMILQRASWSIYHIVIIAGCGICLNFVAHVVPKVQFGRCDVRFIHHFMAVDLMASSTWHDLSKPRCERTCMLGRWMLPKRLLLQEPAPSLQDGTLEPWCCARV